MVNGTAGWGAEVATGAFNPAPASTLVMDFDNDGQDDILYPSTAASGAGTWLVMRGSNTGLQAPLNTTAPNWNHSAAQVMEWDGDGLPDLLVPCSNGATWCVFYQRAGTEPNRVFASTPLDTGVAITQPGTASAAHWLAADINGDGRSDLVRVGQPTGGNPFFAVRIRSGSGFQTEVTAYVASDITLGSFERVIWTKKRSSAGRIDFDGDGREDFYVFSEHPTQGYGMAIFRAFDFAASSTPFYVQYTGVLEWVDVPLYPGDLNGDGLTDVVHALDGYSLRAHYGNGQGLDPAVTNGPVLDGWGAIFCIADIDADGKSDIVANHPSHNDTWMYSRSFGNSLGNLVDSGLAAVDTGSVVVGDVNGDGLADLVRTVSSASHEWRVRLHAGVVPDLLDRVTDGLDNFVDFDYRSTGLDDPFYTPSTVAPTYPARNYNRPMILAERFTANDGAGGAYVVRFEYKGGVLNLHGRGFQGFAARTVYDSRDDRVLRETLSTAFPHNNWVEREELSVAGHDVYVKNASHVAHDYGSGFAKRYFPYASTESVEQYGDAGNIVKRVTTSNTVDTWGTTTDQTVTLEEVSGGLNAGAVHTLQTAHPLVTNDQTNWCLGKPTQTQQINTHTLPSGAQITRTTNLSWDTTLCRLTGTVVEPGDPKWQVTTTYGYDDFGNVNTATATPATGQGQTARVTSMDWGATGRFPLTITNPLDHVTTFAWDVKRGLRTGITTPNGLTQSYQFDPLGRTTRVTHVDGAATEFVLNWCTTSSCQGADTNIRLYLQQIARASDNAEITQVRHYLDGYGREVLTQAKLLDGTYTSVRRVFEARGLVRQTSRPFITAGTEAYETVTYDHLLRPALIRRPTSDSDPSNHDVQFTYEDYKTTVTDALGHTSISYVDAASQIIRTTDGGGGISEYEYDAFGNLRKTRDPLGSVIDVAYNVRGMKMTTNDPDMGPWTYDYYPIGELKSQTDAKNKTITFTYDKLSRLLTRSMPDGAGSITSTFTWDNSSTATNIGSLQSTQISGTGITTYQEAYGYDVKGRLSQTTYSEGATNYLVEYTYNTNTGFLETITYPTSTSGYRLAISYEYQNGLPSRVWSSSKQWWIANASDASGNLTDATLGDPADGNTVQVLSVYDSITNQLQSRGATVTLGTLAGTVISNLGFLYDRSGNVIQRQDNQQGLTENFYYDSRNRLDYSTRGSQTIDYTYDARGNITAKTGVGTYNYTANVAGCSYYAHPQVHAVRQITGGSATQNFCYDANGNMTNRNGTALTWFANNLPKAITNDASNSSTFEYTPTGQRWRHVYRAAGSTYTHTYIGDLVEKVVGPTTTDWKHYVFVNGEAIALYIRSSNGAKTTNYLVKDNLGGMAAIVRNSGTWTVRESFEVFGERRNPSSWSGPPSATDLTKMRDTTRRGFTSHEHLDSTGLIHMNGRVFDPAIGRFVSADPFVQAPYFSQSLNRYSYAFNNPLRYTDPSGFDLETVLPGTVWFPFLPPIPWSRHCYTLTCGGEVGVNIDVDWTALILAGVWPIPDTPTYQTPTDPTPGPSEPTPGPSDPTPGPSDPTPGPSDPTPGPSDPTPRTIREFMSASTVPEPCADGGAASMCHATPDALPPAVQAAYQITDAIGETWHSFSRPKTYVTKDGKEIPFIAGMPPLPGGPANGITITQRGLAHVLARHTAGGARTAGKSLFAEGEDVSVLIRNANTAARSLQVGGNYERTIDAGRIIGVDRVTGQSTSVYTVITNAADDLITAFPGRP